MWHHIVLPMTAEASNGGQQERQHLSLIYDSDPDGVVRIFGNVHLS